MSPPTVSILVVSSDPLLGNALRDGLRARGYAVRLAGTSGEARVHLQRGGWAAGVVDTDLESGRGADLVRWAMEELESSVPPLLLLGAPGADPARLEGLVERMGGRILPRNLETPLHLVLQVEDLVGAGTHEQRLLARQNPLVVEDSPYSVHIVGRAPAIRVLTTLAIRQETGSLRRAFGDEVHEIRLVRGGMVASHTPDDTDLLGQMTIEAGLVEAETMEELLGRQSPLSLGERLVREGLVSPPAIRALIRMQIRRRVLTILCLDGGRLDWSPEPMPRDDPLRVVVPPIPVAWEATRDIPPWAPGADEARPVPGRSVALIAPELPLREPQRAFVRYLDGTRTLAEAAEEVGIDMMAALHLAARFEAVGAVLDHEGRSRVPPTAIPPPPSRPEGSLEAENEIYRHIKAEAWKEAVRGCEQLVEAGASSPRVYCWLGWARFRMGASVAACIPTIQRALALDPDYILAHRVMSRILTRRHHSREIDRHERIADLLAEGES